MAMPFCLLIYGAPILEDTSQAPMILPHFSLPTITSALSMLEYGLFIVLYTMECGMQMLENTCSGGKCRKRVLIYEIDCAKYFTIFF